jgi:pilus assembly protein CpaB
MRTKSIALLGLALACGLVASLGITQVMARRSSEVLPTTPGDTEAILVAIKDVAQGDPLTPQALKIEQWPKDKMPPGSMTSLEEVEGRRTRAKLYAGEPILENKLLPKGASLSGADIMIPKGFRVVSVRVDAVSGGANLILPGSRVDLLVHVTKNPSQGFSETTTRTILQDLKVFAVNEVVSVDGSAQDTKSIAARTVSLLVTPAQAEKVMLAQELGQIKLVMRSPEEDAQTVTEGARPSALFGDSEKSVREKEKVGGDPTIGDTKENGNGSGFIDFLQAVREKADAVKAVAPEVVKETWSMRILAGGDVSEVALEGPDQSTTADGGSWKVNGLKAAGKSPKATPSMEKAVAPKDPTPPAPQGQEQKPPQDKPAPAS